MAVPLTAGPREKPRTGGVAKAARIAVGSVMLIVSQSLIFGLAVLPALLFWQFARTLNAIAPVQPYGGYVIVAMSLVPAYLLFCISLMALSAGWNRLARWETSEGSYSLSDGNWKLIRWASYNASINVVRIFCGESMRATPLWTVYLRWNGAKIGKGVHVNTARLFDHNLLVLDDKVVIGGDAKLVAHLVERGHVVATPVVLRRGAVVGINTVVSPGVEIGENAAVGAMSFVAKHHKIPAFEVWGGVPAQFLKRYGEDDAERKGLGVPVLN